MPIGGASKKASPKESLYTLLDIVLVDKQRLKFSVVYKSEKSNKIYITSPASQTSVPIFSDFPPIWIIPTNKQHENKTNTVEAVYFEFTTRSNRASDYSSIWVEASISQKKYMSHLENFFAYMERNKLEDKSRETVIQEVMKRKLNYTLHLSWNQVNVEKIQGNIPSFTLLPLSEAPHVPPNSPITDSGNIFSQLSKRSDENSIMESSNNEKGNPATEENSEQKNHAQDPIEVDPLPILESDQVIENSNEKVGSDGQNTSQKTLTFLGSIKNFFGNDNEKQYDSMQVPDPSNQADNESTKTVTEDVSQTSENSLTMEEDPPIEDESFTVFNKQVQEELEIDKLSDDDTIMEGTTSWGDEVNATQMSQSGKDNQEGDPNGKKINDEERRESNSEETQDIRRIEYINETDRIKEWCSILDLGCKTAKEIVEFFLSVKGDKKGRTNRKLDAIFTKIERIDRGFFRSFASNQAIKPAHQKEYEKLEEDYINNYKKAYNVGYVNRTTKKKIRVVINKALFVAFLRSKKVETSKYWEASIWIDYGFNFFIDPKREKIKFEEIRAICKELILDKLPNLPESPEQIPASTKIKIPVHIPIRHPKYTRMAVESLRNFYAFQKLPESYFVRKLELPIDPANLKDKYRRNFPLTERNQLRGLEHLVDEMREDYKIEGKLPESYFELPPPKEKLPNDYRDLPDDLGAWLPVTDDIESIRKVSKKLREKYAFIRLPNDYIIRRKPLPPAHWFAESQGMVLPITDQNEANIFLPKLEKNYLFRLPLGKDWISEEIVQQIRPNLPSEFEKVRKECNLPAKLNKDNPEYDMWIKRIKEKYHFTNVPAEWITGTIPDISSLEEAKQSLKERGINVTLPLIESETLQEQIKYLRHHFYFDRLPEEFITQEELPEPGLAQIPVF
jgi:hypothetical protein